MSALALQTVPPLCCDICSWPMGAHEIVRNPDGSIPGLLVCTQCTEDNRFAASLDIDAALAAQAMEPVTL